MMVRLLQPDDYDVWLQLAREVEPLFGPMVDVPEFLEGISVCISNQDAYGMEDEQGNVTGIIALSRMSNEILWLAVGEKYRGLGYGESLVAKAIEELEAKGDIFVQTFSTGTEEGESARKLYDRFGFQGIQKAGKNPAGIETMIMRRQAVK